MKMCFSSGLILPCVTLPGLILPGSHHDCYDDAVRDNNPPGAGVHLCKECEKRGMYCIRINFHTGLNFRGFRGSAAICESFIP